MHADNVGSRQPWTSVRYVPGLPLRKPSPPSFSRVFGSRAPLAPSPRAVHRQDRNRRRADLDDRRSSRGTSPSTASALRDYADHTGVGLDAGAELRHDLPRAAPPHVARFAPRSPSTSRTSSAARVNAVVAPARRYCRHAGSHRHGAVNDVGFFQVLNIARRSTSGLGVPLEASRRATRFPPPPRRCSVRWASRPSSTASRPWRCTTRATCTASRARHFRRACPTTPTTWCQKNDRRASLRVQLPHHRVGAARHHQRLQEPSLALSGGRTRRRRAGGEVIAAIGRPGTTRGSARGGRRTAQPLRWLPCSRPAGKGGGFDLGDSAGDRRGRAPLVADGGWSRQIDAS